MSVEVTFSQSEPTPHQLLLADRLTRVLDERVRFECVLATDAGNGPSFEFEIRTRPPDLGVVLVLYQDSYHVCANEAEARIELASFDNYEEWADDVVAITAHLFSRPLRLRVRKPLLRLFPSEGAILLSVDGRAEGWSGNIAFGRGHESVFEDWYEPAL